MKYALDGTYCPNCGLVFKVLQVPWPHTGEWMPYKHPKRCPECGEILEGESNARKGKAG